MVIVEEIFNKVKTDLSKYLYKHFICTMFSIDTNTIQNYNIQSIVQTNTIIQSQKQSAQKQSQHTTGS